MGIVKAKRPFFRWQSGRQQSGYLKMLLLRVRWPASFDVYLLKFPTGCCVPPHKDPVRRGRHYRLNIVLKQAKMGGDFVCRNPLFETRRIKLFRPDISEHAVTRVMSGNRYLLSIGWLSGSGNNPDSMGDD